MSRPPTSNHDADSNSCTADSSNTREELRIAYLILAHKNFDQVALLAKTLKEEWSEVFIHVDAKVPFDKNAFLELLGESTVALVEPRMNVHWAHVSQIEAILLLLKRAYADLNRFDRFVLLSGQDLPIVSNAEIQAFFYCNKDVEFLEFKKFPVHWWPYGGWDRVLVYSFPDRLSPFFNKCLRAFQMLLPYRRKLKPDLELFGAATWFNITREAAEEIIQASEATRILADFKYSYGGDEIFFQTILLNSPLGPKCVNRALRFMIWPKGASGPRILRNEDFDEISKHSHLHLFARKFDMHVDNEIVQRVLLRVTAPLDQRQLHKFFGERRNRTFLGAK